MEETRRQRNNNQDVTNDAGADVTTNESDNPRENGVFFAGNKTHSCHFDIMPPGRILVFSDWYLN